MVSNMLDVESCMRTSAVFSVDEVMGGDTPISASLMDLAV